MIDIDKNKMGTENRDARGYKEERCDDSDGSSMEESSISEFEDEQDDDNKDKGETFTRAMSKLN